MTLNNRVKAEINTILRKAEQLDYVPSFWLICIVMFAMILLSALCGLLWALVMR